MRKKRSRVTRVGGNFYELIKRKAEQKQKDLTETTDELAVLLREIEMRGIDPFDDRLLELLEEPSDKKKKRDPFSLL
jgi:hypothetical protein